MKLITVNSSVFSVLENPLLYQSCHCLHVITIAYHWLLADICHRKWKFKRTFEIMWELTIITWVRNGNFEQMVKFKDLCNPLFKNHFNKTDDISRIYLSQKESESKQRKQNLQVDFCMKIIVTTNALLMVKMYVFMFTINPCCLTHRGYIYDFT